MAKKRAQRSKKSSVWRRVRKAVSRLARRGRPSAKRAKPRAAGRSSGVRKDSALVRRAMATTRQRPTVVPRLEKKKKKRELTQEEIERRKALSLAQLKKLREGEEGVDTERTRDQTPMKIYLDQIENIPLLTPEEERRLARHVKEGGIKAIPARERMIRCNLRLVISIAKRYTNLGLSFSDLVEEGNIGLMRAVDKFNYKRGYRFSTYASWWIKQAIMRALSNQGKTIRVPVYMFDIISKYRKVKDALIQQHGRIPTRNELAKAMQVPPAKIRQIEGVADRPSSLNTPVSIDGSAELIDLIEDTQALNPIEQTDESFKSDRIEQLLKHLDDREREILTLRFGLRGKELHTLEQAAQKFGVTRERVRQIESAALKKIRQLILREEDRLENYIY